MTKQDARHLEILLKDTGFEIRYCAQLATGIMDITTYDTFEECLTTPNQHNISIDRVIPLIYLKDEEAPEELKPTI